MRGHTLAIPSMKLRAVVGHQPARELCLHTCLPQQKPISIGIENRTLILLPPGQAAPIGVPNGSVLVLADVTGSSMMRLAVSTQNDPAAARRIVVVVPESATKGWAI